MWAKVDDGWWCHPKVMGLSLPARGLWISALSWSCAQRLDEVPTQFLAMVQADEALAAELVAAGLWIEADGGWRIHDWAEYQELTKSEKRAEAGRKGGIRSGESRRRKSKQTEANTAPDQPKRRSKPKQTAPASEANAEAGTRPVPSRPVPTQETLSAEVELAAVPPVDQFEEFWSVYPRRRDRGHAEKAWAKAIKIATADEIIAGAERYAAEQTRPLARGEWRPDTAYAATWLNGKRWLDEIPPPESRRAAGEKPGFLTDADRDQPSRVLTKEEFIHGLA